MPMLMLRRVISIAYLWPWKNLANVAKSAYSETDSGRMTFRHSSVQKGLPSDMVQFKKYNFQT